MSSMDKIEIEINSIKKKLKCLSKYIRLNPYRSDSTLNNILKKLVKIEDTLNTGQGGTPQGGTTPCKELLDYTEEELKKAMYIRKALDATKNYKETGECTYDLSLPKGSELVKVEIVFDDYTGDCSNKKYSFLKEDIDEYFNINKYDAESDYGIYEGDEEPDFFYLKLIESRLKKDFISTEDCRQDYTYGNYVMRRFYKIPGIEEEVADCEDHVQSS